MARQPYGWQKVTNPRRQVSYWWVNASGVVEDENCARMGTFEDLVDSGHVFFDLSKVELDEMIHRYGKIYDKGWHWMYDAVGKRHSVYLTGDGTVGNFGDVEALVKNGHEFYKMTPEEAEVEEERFSEKYKEYADKITAKAKKNVLGEEDVKHPKHYNTHPSGVECLTIVRHMNFNLGNVVKYIWRAGLKTGQADIQDLEKAMFYLKDEIERRKGAKD